MAPPSPTPADPGSVPSTAIGPQFASAISDAAQTSTALEQITSQLAGRLPGSVDLAIVFATAHHRDAVTQIHQGLDQALGARVTLGTTAAGVIGRRCELEAKAGLSVLIGTLPGTTLQPFGYEPVDWQQVASSPEALRRCIDANGHELRALVLLADPFSTPMTNLLPTLDHCYGGVPAVGGMASAGNKPGSNVLWVNGRFCRQGTVGVAIGGAIRVDCTISQGCRPIGKPLVITKSRRHVVYELGGRGVIDVIQQLIGDLDERDRHLIETRGLMIGRVISEYKERFGRGDFLIRHLLAMDPDAGYMAINDPQVRAGQTVQFHVHDQQTAVEDFRLLLEGQQLHGRPRGALLFSCNGRGTNLFDKPNTDASLVSEALGDVPLAGFFAAGEIGPVGTRNFLHGHTASLLVFRSNQEKTAAPSP